MRDDELKRLFSAVRDEDRRVTPDLGSLLANATPPTESQNDRPRLWWQLMPPMLLAASAVVLIWLVGLRSDTSNGVRSASGLAEVNAACDSTLAALERELLDDKLSWQTVTWQTASDGLLNSTGIDDVLPATVDRLFGPESRHPR